MIKIQFSSPSFPGHARHYPVEVMIVGLLFFTLLLLQFFSSSLQTLLELTADTFSKGQVWRLMTAHFVHASWSHLGINFASLIAFFCLFPEMLRAKPLVTCVVVNGFLLGLSLWWVLPENITYLGLSGLLYGLLASAAVVNFKRNGFSLWVLGFLVIKNVWEQSFGPMTSSEQLAGGQASIEAHLFGSVIGLTSGFALRPFLR